MSVVGDWIMDAINGWVEEFMEWILLWINKMVFSIPESKFVDDVSAFFIWYTGVAATVVVSYKVIEYIIHTQNGTQEYPLDELILRLIKSAAATVILPWMMKVLVFDIALPISNYLAIASTDFNGEGGYIALTGILAGGLGVATGGSIVIVGALIFFVIVFVMFLYSVCLFYADMVVMQITVGPVALSMIADQNNYVSVWWRELLSQITSILVKLFLVTLVINQLFSNGSVLLAIGAGALIIKTPSVLKNMWYGGSGSKGVAKGAAFGTRALMSKLVGR